MNRALSQVSEVFAIALITANLTACGKQAPPNDHSQVDKSLEPKRAVKAETSAVAQSALSSLGRFGPPEVERLFTLLSDRTLVHAKVSERGNAVALWVRRQKSVQLLSTVLPPVEFNGHIGFVKGLSFSAIQPDGSRDIAKAGKDVDKETWLVWGPGTGFEGEPLDNYLIFDTSGKHLVYTLWANGRWSWRIDDKELAGLNRLSAPVVGDGATSIAWIDDSNGEQRVVVNGKPGEPYDFIPIASLRVGPGDGRSFYAASTKSGKWLAVWNGQQQAQYESMGLARFSPNGDRVAYSAVKNGKHRYVLDGKEGPEYDKVAAGTFSGNSRHFAYRANKADKAFFVVDGQPEPAQFENLANEIVFAPQGGRYAYAGVRGETWHVVVDGTEGTGCRAVAGMTFNQDGKHFAKAEISRACPSRQSGWRT